MFENVMSLIKTRNLVVPGVLFFNASKLGINNDELYFLIYVLNLSDLKFDIAKMSEELNMKPKIIVKLANDLSEKDLLKIDNIKEERGFSEYINLDGLYRKISFMTMNKEEEPVKVTLYDEFEKEFKRLLTPKEMQIVATWKEVGYLDETILLALKEACYNEVFSFAYIDKILDNWNKKGIRTKEDVEKNREEYSKKKEEIISFNEDDDYDWLNE